MSEADSARVEDLLATIDSGISELTTNFELHVPFSLTWDGANMTADVAMAIVLDRILGKGLMPDGFIQRPSGRLYRYTRPTPTET